MRDAGEVKAQGHRGRSRAWNLKGGVSPTGGRGWGTRSDPRCVWAPGRSALSTEVGRQPCEECNEP